MRYQQPLRYVEAVANAGSIRKAAESLAITSTALNRRILSIEEDLGAPLFERLPAGVRLSAAGEIFLHFARRELAESSRMREQIDELSGERRGHINLACGQSLMLAHLPGLISGYRRDHSRVTINLRLIPRAEVTQQLESCDVDLALVLEPEPSSAVDVLASTEQPVQLIGRRDHPLLQDTHPVRLDDCFDYPMALPSRALGVRHLLDERASALGRPLPVVVESDSALLISRLLATDWTISFAVPAGQMSDGAIDADLATRQVDSRDLRPAKLTLLQLRGRTLPVAAAKFAERLSGLLHESATAPIHRGLGVQPV